MNELNGHSTRTCTAAAGLGSLKRKIALTRTKPAAVTIVDTFAAREQAVSVAMPLYVPVKPRQRKPGAWEIPAGKNALVLEYDPLFFKCTVQRVDIDDKRLGEAWGKALFKFMLTSKKKHERGEYQLHFTAKK
jgi:hypothetical protein